MGDIKAKAVKDAEASLNLNPTDAAAKQKVEDVKKANLKVSNDVYAIGNNHLAANKPVDYGVVNFDGSGDYIQTVAKLPTGDEITIEYWFKGTNLQSAVRQQDGSNYIVAGWSNQHIISVDGVTDYKDNPILPGEKVDRYRFMSFYLEPSTQHFQDFFNYVVDPEWLQSNDEEARALRQAQAGKPNKIWRVLHRVTYVERPALMGFGRDVRQFKVRDENVGIGKIMVDVASLQQKVDQILEWISSQPK